MAIRATIESANVLRSIRDNAERELDAHPVGDPLHKKYWDKYISAGDRVQEEEGRILKQQIKSNQKSDARREAVALMRANRAAVNAARVGYKKPSKEESSKYTATYKDKPVATKAGAVVPSGGNYVLEGSYGTKADANIVRRSYKDTHFVRVLPLGAGGYNVWIKERGAGDGKASKSYNLKGSIREFRDKDRELAPPSAARWADFGTLPEYKPPNFQLDKSGYKPLDYKPIDSSPMFKPTGFKTMDYKSTYKPLEYKTIGSEPYYKPSEYRPIGQFGVAVNNTSSQSTEEPKKRKKKKTKEPRLVV